MAKDRNTPQMDWRQVVANGGPPCFAVLEDEEGWYCGRAERWEGHDGEHKFIPLADLLSAARAEQGGGVVDVALAELRELFPKKSLHIVHGLSGVPPYKPYIHICQGVQAYAVAPTLLEAMTKMRALAVRTGKEL